MAIIIIDGLCPERALYAGHIARATGWEIKKVNPFADILDYANFADSPADNGGNIILDGFQIAHHAADWTTPQDKKNLAYCAARLSNCVNVHYSLVTDLEEFFIIGSLDKYVQLSGIHRTLLNSAGEAVAFTYAGTVKQQKKGITLSPFGPYQRSYRAERERLFNVYGK